KPPPQNCSRAGTTERRKAVSSSLAKRKKLPNLMLANDRFANSLLVLALWINRMPLSMNWMGIPVPVPVRRPVIMGVFHVRSLRGDSRLRFRSCLVRALEKCGRVSLS
ncbi:hypothetical protein LTR66_017279, partial [Elasticomyces elasticus]